MPLDLCKNAGPIVHMTDVLSARQLLDHLVSFPTVSSDTNLPLIHFVRDYFAQHGIESVVYPNEDGNKAGLVAQVGPNVAGGVALSGHSDVVPVEGQDWSTNPWQVVEKRWSPLWPWHLRYEGLCGLGYGGHGESKISGP